MKRGSGMHEPTLPRDCFPSVSAALPGVGRQAFLTRRAPLGSIAVVNTMTCKLMGWGPTDQTSVDWRGALWKSRSDIR